MGLVQ
jgi:hypothetical protein